MSYKIDKTDLMLLAEEPIEIADYFVLKPNIDAKRKLKTDISKINVVDYQSVDAIIKRKLKRQLERVIAITLMVIDDDDDDPDVLEQALDEAAKFQAMLRYKYEHFLDKNYVLNQHDKLKKVIGELKNKRVRSQSYSSSSKAR